MVNPFCDSSNVEILKEAFPSLYISVIEDKLLLANGDVNRAFEMLLELTDPSQSAANGPPLPNRPLDNGYSLSSPGVNKPLPNPFLNTNPHAKPLTTREELALWRQDLREESRQRAENSRNNSPSSSHVSLSKMFKSNTSRSSLQERDRENDRNNYTICTNSVAQPSFPRPLIPTSRTASNVSNPMYSSSTPNVNYHTHNRSASNPSYNPSSAAGATLSPPALPRRRQSSNSLNHNNNTNPFLTTHDTPTRRPVPNIPPTNPNHRESTTDNGPSFNPFEEPELPPPAYSEIQRDVRVDLVP